MNVDAFVSIVAIGCRMQLLGLILNLYQLSEYSLDYLNGIEDSLILASPFHQL